MNEKMVIFDLDGTLLNTIDDITFALNDALSKLKYRANYSVSQVKKFVGNGVDVLATKALKPLAVSDLNQIHELRDLYNIIYAKNSMMETKPYPYMINVLLDLKKEGFLLGVYSNKPHKDTTKIVKYYFGDLFDFVLGKCEQFQPKPSVDGLKHILQVYPYLDLNKAFYVGDSDVDMETGKNLGFKTIAVTYGFRDIEVLRKYHPYAIVSNTKDIYNVVMNIRL